MIRLPAEWEPQARVFVSRPANVETWPTPDSLEMAQREFEALFDAIAEVTPTTDVAELGIPVNDAWLRDTTPIFVVEGASEPGPSGPGLNVQARCFRFTAYGHKFPHDLDEHVALRLAKALDLPHTTHDLAFEGGALETNGRGIGVTTRACVLEPARNPGLTHDQLANQLRDTLGITKLVVLDCSLPGDFTDGHIDNLLRFTSPDHALCVTPLLVQAREHIAPLGVELTELPLPDPPTFTYSAHMHEAGAQPLAASYANFLVTNGRVLLPVYGQPTDRDAERIVRQAFPDHDFVALPSNHLLIGGGSFHCLTAHLPAPTTQA